MLPKQSIIPYLMYMNFYINAPPIPPRIEIWGRNVQGAKRPVGAKHPGAKRPGAKRPGGETARGGNGLGAKRPGTRPRTIIHQDLCLGKLVPSPHKRSKLSN